MHPAISIFILHHQHLLIPMTIGTQFGQAGS
jgi:hypothetical protein